MRRVLAAFAAVCLAGPRLGAQQRFVTQVLLVPTFHGPDVGAAHRAGDVVRNALDHAFDHHALDVVSAGQVASWLRKSGYDEDMVLQPAEMIEVARHFRADEEVLGTAARTPSGFRVDAELRLTRDPTMVQPLAGQGPTLDSAAALVAHEAIAARAQMVPLRDCENAVRSRQLPEAIAAARRAIAAYPRAVFARDCLLDAFTRQGAPDSVVVRTAREVLAVTPADAHALEYLATALDGLGESTDAGAVWVRLLATDSTDETMIRRVVEALSREGNAQLAEPIVVRGTQAFPDNLPLLKLRWLVHLATANWKSAVEVGEQLRARDEASQVDPEFYRRLASAYRSDSQPVRALAVAAAGVAQFDSDAALYSLYVQLLQNENGIAVARGLMQFPDNADLHAIAAQSLQEKGATAQAAVEIRRALAANPRLPHGWLQLADYDMTLNRPDSAYVALDSALAHGESPATVGQFALARGNDLLVAANGTKLRADYERAHRFLQRANRLSPSPQAAFLVGASALSISQTAATEAPAAKSCELARLADSTLTEAEENITTGREVAPDAAQQYLAYVSTLRPYLAGQLKALCPGA